MTRDLNDIETTDLVSELEDRGYFETCHHADDCDCIDSDDAIDGFDTDDLVTELKARGELGVDRRETEYAYEALLRADYADAAKHLKRALHPNGGADTIAHRVKQDMAAVAAQAKKAA